MTYSAEAAHPPIEPEIPHNATTAARDTYWDAYYELSQERPPAAILAESVTYVNKKENACDLGAGTLRDARYLLDCGFQHVTTVDSSGPYIKLMEENQDPRIEMRNDDLDLFELPPDSFNLVSGQRVFHYTEGSSFAGGFIKNIAHILKSGGIFTATLFSEKDPLNSGAHKEKGFFPTQEQLSSLLEADFEIIKLEENQKDGETVDGKPVVNYVLELIARKK